MRKVLNKIMSYVPQQVPYGKTAFDAWANSIIDLAGPVADKDSMRWVISSKVTNLPPDKSRHAKNYFVQSLYIAAAKQIAGAVFTEIKEKQRAAQAAQQAEVTATTNENTVSAQKGQTT